jgi:hypothetical protein
MWPLLLLQSLEPLALRCFLVARARSLTVRARELWRPIDFPFVPKHSLPLSFSPTRRASHRPVTHTYSCRSPRRLQARRTRTAAMPIAATWRARKPVTRTPAAHTRPSPPTHELDAPPTSRSCQPDAALTGLRVRQVEPLVAVEVATQRGHSPAPLSASSSDYLHSGCPSFGALTLSVVISTYGLTSIFLTLSSSFYLFPFLYSLRVLVVYRNSPFPISP